MRGIFFFLLLTQAVQLASEEAASPDLHRQRHGALVVALPEHWQAETSISPRIALWRSRESALAEQDPIHHPALSLFREELRRSQSLQDISKETQALLLKTADRAQIIDRQEVQAGDQIWQVLQLRFFVGPLEWRQAWYISKQEQELYTLVFSSSAAAWEAWASLREQMLAVTMDPSSSSGH